MAALALLLCLRAREILRATGAGSSHPDARQQTVTRETESLQSFTRVSETGEAAPARSVSSGVSCRARDARARSPEAETSGEARRRERDARARPPTGSGTWEHTGTRGVGGRARSGSGVGAGPSNAIANGKQTVARNTRRIGHCHFPTLQPHCALRTPCIRLYAHTTPTPQASVQVSLVLQHASAAPPLAVYGYVASSTTPTLIPHFVQVSSEAPLR